MTKMVSSLEKNNDFNFSDKVNSSTSVINRSKNRKTCSEQQQQQQQQQQQKSVSSNKRSEKEIQEPSNVHVLILFILFLLFVFFYTGLRVYLRPTKPPITVTVNTFQEYLTEIQQIKYMYFTQTEEFWNILKDNAQQLLMTDKEDKTPAAMMVILPAGEKQLAVCLMDYWSQIMNRLLGSQISDSALEPVVDGSSITSYKPGHQKSIMSEQIQQLVANGHKSVTISSWENLHIETLQLLCSICESTNLFYKQVTMVFLLEIPDEEHHIENKSDILTYLSSIWSHLKNDQVKNLLHVIANNIAFLTPDDTFMGC